MTTQHTSGPWHYEKHLGRYEVWPKDQGQTHSSVATVNIEDNARLIAAAPELLEALEELLDGNPPGKVEFHVTEVGLAKARAAIAKAKGGAQ